MPKMKALSIWQPWASLIACGSKRFETRSWRTNYRGPLVICAAKHWPTKRQMVDWWLNFVNNHVYEEVIKNIWPSNDLAVLSRRQYLPLDHIYLQMPFGAALATGNLINCYPTEDMDLDAREIAFGDYSPGRYAWKLENVRKIEPFLVTGRQGLFEVEVPILSCCLGKALGELK